ncbi:MAG TPA: tol-pal system protein YbgF [Micropepsaceae bacterium]|nr:tol-pal system protein YbgF [Micropepsaceae bacterium]
MTALHRHWTSWAGAFLISAAQIQFAAAAPASAPSGPSATDYNQLVTRLQRLERDMRDVEAATFRKPPGDKADAPPPVDKPEAAETPPPVMPDLNPLMRRIDELEEGLGKVTGQMEVLGHQVDQLTQKADRLQKQLDLQAAARAKAEADEQTAGQAPPETKDADQIASADKPAAPATESGLAKPPGVLGTIPAGSTLPKPAPDNVDPRKQFDAAMGLLARAKYDEASDAFRAFVDAHPELDRASDALYWSGDIAYSTKKDYPTAARDFAELLKKYPKAQRAPDGMLKLGLALFEMGQTKEGCAAVAALPAKYPDASAAILTRARSVRDDKKCK